VFYRMIAWPPAPKSVHSSRWIAGTIELIETVSVTPERVEKSFSGPRPRIHHVAYAVPRSEVADLRSSLDERRRGLGWFGTAARGRELTAASATELPGLSATTRR
jgi:hypothetical protein